MIKFRAFFFFFRYCNEIQSVHGRRPAASWSQSALQLPGSPSAAQTMRGRWDINDASHSDHFNFFPFFRLTKKELPAKPSRTEPWSASCIKWCALAWFVSLCRWWSSTASHVRRPCVWTAQRASTGSMWLFPCGTWWSSTRLCWRHSWMPYAAGEDLTVWYLEF